MQGVADAFGYTCGVRVQRGRVLKIDRPLAGGFLSLTGPLAPRVVVSPLRAMNIKSALREWLFMSYGIISILLIGSLRSPSPIRLRRTAPCSGGRIKHLEPSLRKRLCSKHGLLCSRLRGKGGGASHQRGIAFPRPSGRLYGFRRQRRYKKWRRRRHTSPAQRYYITPEGGALNPPVRRQPITGRTLGAQGQRPGGAINPRPRKRASTFGNTGKHRLLNPVNSCEQ